MAFVRTGVIILSALFSFAADAGEDYLQSLTEEKARLMDAISKAEGGVIYSEAFREIEYSFIEKKMTRRTNYEAQMELWSAGKELIGFLENTSQQYYGLPYNQWLLAKDVLLSIDDLIQNDIGWGNLVIKICIYNKLYYWIFDYIDKTDDIDKAQLKQLFAVLSTLRNHMPSREAMTYLALKYYGYDDYKKSSGFKLTIPVSDESEVLENSLYAYFGSKEDAAQAVSKITGIEAGKEVSDYVDLYKNPLPWSAAQSGLSYMESSWALYLVMSLMQDKGIAFNDMRAVTKEDLNTTLGKVYNSENKFWMTRAAIDAIEKSEIYASGYLKSVQSDRVINQLIRNHREHGRNDKPVASRRFSLTKFD